MSRHLFTTYYYERNPSRRGELDECLRRNLESKLFSDIYISVEGNVVPPIKSSPFTGVHAAHLNRRPKFSDIFRWINSITDKNDLNVVANSDIYFSDSILLADAVEMDNICFILSRWDVKDSGEVIHHCVPDSQDAWIFRGTIKDVDADFDPGTAGCLAGETIVHYNRGKRNGGRDITIDDLYLAFNNISPKFRHRNIPTFLQSFNFSDEVIFYNKVESVVESGIKQTIKISFDNDTKLILTPDHLVLVNTQNQEFINAGSLSVGDKVISRGPLLATPSGKKRTYGKRKIVYVKHHPFGFKMRIKGFEYNRVYRARLVVEAAMNNLDYKEFIDIIKHDAISAASLKYLPSNIDVHHKDENTLNDIIDNLEVKDHIEHARDHGLKENFHMQHTTDRFITKIEPYDDIMTYDIQMRGPANNYCANNIIVHNCDNRLAAALDEAGYAVKNPSKSIKAFHLHNSNYRTYDPTKIVTGPYLLLYPTILEIK